MAEDAQHFGPFKIASGVVLYWLGWWFLFQIIGIFFLMITVDGFGKGVFEGGLPYRIGNAFLRLVTSGVVGTLFVSPTIEKKVAVAQAAAPAAVVKAAQGGGGKTSKGMAVFGKYFKFMIGSTLFIVMMALLFPNKMAEQFASSPSLPKMKLNTDFINTAVYNLNPQTTMSKTSSDMYLDMVQRDRILMGDLDKWKKECFDKDGNPYKHTDKNGTTNASIAGTVCYPYPVATTG